MSNVVLV